MIKTFKSFLSSWRMFEISVWLKSRCAQSFTPSLLLIMLHTNLAKPYRKQNKERYSVMLKAKVMF